MIEAYEKGEAPAVRSLRPGPEAQAPAGNHALHRPRRAGPLFVPSVGNFKQGMLVQLPLHLDLLPGNPKAADLHDALATHYAASNTPEAWVSVEPATESGKLDALALNDTNKMELRVFGNDEFHHAVLIARLDNLGKGASGAAVQNLQADAGAVTPAKAPTNRTSVDGVATAIQKA